MRFESERELEDMLFDRWWDLRRDGRFPELEPVDDHETGIGLSRMLFRQARIPGAAYSGGDGVVDMIEVQLLAIPTSDDESWRPWIEIAAVELKNQPINAAHVGQAIRYRSCLDAFLRRLRESGAIYSGPFENAGRVTSLLIGPSIPNEMAVVAAGVPSLSIYTFTFDIMDGIDFERSRAMLDLYESANETSHSVSPNPILGWLRRSNRPWL